MSVAPDTDQRFTGSIPEIYDRDLVPLIFAPYADDLAQRAAALRPARVLEVAAGTGVVTRALDRALDDRAQIVATDLNAAMLDRARSVGTRRAVHWQPADVMTLPFDDASFDVVVCQFGAMFFPDKAAAYAGMRRVLRSGGTLLFNVWDRIAANTFACIVTDVLRVHFPDHPPDFLARTPHGYYDRAAIERDLRAGGFGQRIAFDTVAFTSHAASPTILARAMCHGTPLRFEIEARGATALVEATRACEAALAAALGTGRIEGTIQAHVLAVTR